MCSWKLCYVAMTEVYQIPQGEITINFCDEDLSIGLLTLNPNQQLTKHNRPVDEELVQIYGSCVIKIFSEDKIEKEINLKKGERLVIPKNQFHVHFNPYKEKSITSWKFEGDIISVIEGIKNTSRKIL